MSTAAGRGLLPSLLCRSFLLPPFSDYFTEGLVVMLLVGYSKATEAEPELKDERHHPEMIGDAG